MANTAANVRVGATGKIFGGTGTLPAAASTPGVPTTDWDDYGYISEDGVSQTLDKSTTAIKAWGGQTVRTVTSDHEVSYTFTFLETSAAVLAAYYGDPDATDTAVKIKRVDGLRQQWVLDVLDGANRIRLVIPDGQITETGDISYKADDAIGYEVTVTCYPDSSDVNVYKYLSAA